MSSRIRKVGLILMVLTLVIGITGAQERLKPNPDNKASCPCFTQQQIAAIPVPYMQCVLEYTYPSYVWSNIIYEQGVAGADSIVYDHGGGYCVYMDLINDPDGDFLYISDLTNQQAEACNRIIVKVIESNIEYCESLYTGEAE